MGLKDLTTGSAQLGDKIIAEANKSSASIDRRVQGDRYIFFVIQKSFNENIIDFGRNTNDIICVNQ